MIKLYKTQHEYDTLEFDNGATAIDAGVGVDLTAGKLAVSTTPKYVTLQPCGANEKRCLVHEIRKDELYSTTLSASGASLNVGDAVTIATGGKQATATTTSGIFKIEEFKDATKASGSVVVGRFI